MTVIMYVMVSKILKLELFGLFLLTILSFFAFYFAETMPDNFFAISSETSSVNFLGYYLTSIVTMIGYYTGPWVFFPFLLFALLYSFLFSRRDFYLDMTNALSLVGSFLMFTYLLFPSFLGQGLRFFIKTNLSTTSIVLCTLLFLTSFCAGTFRDKFKDSIFSLINFIGSLPQNISLAIKKAKERKITKAKQLPSQSKTGLLAAVKVKLPSLLKGDAELHSSGHISLADRMKGEALANERVAPIQKKLSTPDFVGEVAPNSIMKDKIVKQVFTADGECKSVSFEDKEGFSNSPKVTLRTLRATSDGKEDEAYYSLVESMAEKKSANRVTHPDDSYFNEIISLLEEKLNDFKIEGRIINVLKGPVVDTFELELGTGVKVSKVTSAQEDLSLALYGAPIRIVYPMKGRTTIGIEVPRNPREIIYLDEVLSSNEFKTSNNNLPVAMGKNAFGETFVVDLATMPHMLVAGATGAGKSVFINALLVSLLVKKSPRQMKLILIDPKQLELALYANLPHLIMPVVTDAKTASIALLWAVQEMERRYTILKDFGVRNLAGFNDKLKTATPEMLAKIHQHYVDHGAEDYELPYLVIVVDEFADLILTKAGKEIESNIARVAAKARAAGIHLVLATQRPSVDVITGVIKSNFPTRVSFRVTSSIDSRTILDKMGAEKLLGKGDMLYKHGIETVRVHSSYVDEGEIEELCSKLALAAPEFNDNAMNFIESGGEVEMDEYSPGSHIASSHNNSNSIDSMYSDAVKVVMEQRSASASMLQRRLRIGYNRAANLIEEMESKGIVGPAQGSKPRKVLAALEG